METTVIRERNDYSGLIEGDYYLPLSEGVDPASQPALPGVRYVNAPNYTSHSVVGGSEAVGAALRSATAGFTCPVRGRVFVSALIDSTGTALSPRVTGSIHPDCDARALRAFEMLEFAPAEVGGRPVAMPFTIPVVFR